MTLKKIIMMLLCVCLLCGCMSANGAGKSVEPSFVAPEDMSVPEETAAATEEKEQYSVSNVNELLNAIGPNREIVLAPGEYNLTKAEGYGRIGAEYYHWESCFDGYELVITDVEGMTLRGEDPDSTVITAEPRYAYVMIFDSVSNVTVENMTCGHTYEPSECAGGVLLFENSGDLEVNTAKLYGCGIRGVDLLNCQNFRMDCSDIYQCSYGAVSVQGCYNVLFENSKFYECDFLDGLVTIRGSAEVAVINSEIFKNAGVFGGSLIFSDCSGVYLGGLDIHDNSNMRSALGGSAPMTVENCRFADSWMWDGAAPVDADGKELTEGDMKGMSLRHVSWQAKELPTFTAPEESEDGKIHVTNVDEFLASIGSNVTIYLEPGVYDLSKATNYGSFFVGNYMWESVYDGVELVISDVTNLTIEGAGTDRTSILAVPRYANVLHFRNADGLKLQNFTAGHTEAPGECGGGVIRMTYVNAADIEGCSFFGCGTLGISAFQSWNLSVNNTEIYDCRDGAARFYDCGAVYLDGCSIHDNGEPTYEEYDSDVMIDGARLRRDNLLLQSALPAMEPAEDGKIHVTNADEFLAAIGPDRTIYLEPGIYMLSETADYGVGSGYHYVWDSTYDGAQLIVFDVANLTIEGAGIDQVSIITAPRYASVLRFENSSNLTLCGFTAGHSEGAGECTGSVIDLEGVQNVDIHECSLFGCGVLGVTAFGSSKLEITGTEIYDCRYGGTQFFYCNDVTITDCNIHDNGGDDVYANEECTNVTYHGTIIR